MKISQDISKVIEDIKESKKHGTMLCGPGVGTHGIHYSPEDVTHQIAIEAHLCDFYEWYKLYHREAHGSEDLKKDQWWIAHGIAILRYNRLGNKVWILKCKTKEGEGYALGKNKNWDTFGFSLSKRSASKRLNEKAREIADLVATETELPVVEIKVY